MEAAETFTQPKLSIWSVDPIATGFFEFWAACGFDPDNLPAVLPRLLSASVISTAVLIGSLFSFPFVGRVFPEAEGIDLS